MGELQIVMGLPHFLSTQPAPPPVDAGSLSKPNTVDVASMTDSFADLSKGILKRYHMTARYQLADIVQTPWPRQKQYRADDSALIRIRYFGVISQNQYEMTVASLVRENKQVRTAVQSDNSPISPSSQCSLERWTGL